MKVTTLTGAHAPFCWNITLFWVASSVKGMTHIKWYLTWPQITVPHLILPLDLSTCKHLRVILNELIGNIFVVESWTCAGTKEIHLLDKWWWQQLLFTVSLSKANSLDTWQNLVNDPGDRSYSDKFKFTWSGQVQSEWETGADGKIR